MAKELIVGPRARKRMGYDDALMYCMLLEADGVIGWRLPTKVERCLKMNKYHKDYNDGFWYIGCNDTSIRYVVPVKTAV